MKRFHVNVSVSDLDESIRFYTTLFGAEPAKKKDDYAKWMLDDPRVNFSINSSQRNRGINHIGLQADSTEELGEIRERLRAAGEDTFEQPEAECCYASSTKTWVRDPDDVAWETFVTFGDITHYGEDLEPVNDTCCKTESEESCCSSGD